MTRKRGPDLTGVTMGDDGVPVNLYENKRVLGTPSEELETRQAARSITVHLFLKRKRRLWPTPRI